MDIYKNTAFKALLRAEGHKNKGIYRDIYKNNVALLWKKALRKALGLICWAASFLMNDFEKDRTPL